MPSKVESQHTRTWTCDHCAEQVVVVTETIDKELPLDWRVVKLDYDRAGGGKIRHFIRELCGGCFRVIDGVINGYVEPEFEPEFEPEPEAEPEAEYDYEDEEEVDVKALRPIRRRRRKK